MPRATLRYLEVRAHRGTKHLGSHSWANSQQWRWVRTCEQTTPRMLFKPQSQRSFRAALFPLFPMSLAPLFFCVQAVFVAGSSPPPSPPNPRRPNPRRFRQLRQLRHPLPSLLMYAPPGPQSPAIYAPFGRPKGAPIFCHLPSSGDLLLHCDHGLWVVTWRRSLTRCILSILPFLAVILFRNVTMALGRVLERKAGQLILSFTLRSSL